MDINFTSASLPDSQAAERIRDKPSARSREERSPTTSQPTAISGQRKRNREQIDRTRFFRTIAIKTCNVRLAALVYFVKICRALGKHSPGVWTIGYLGRQIGLSRRQTCRLLDQARKAKALDYERTMRGLRVWLHEEVRDHYNLREDPPDIGYYRLSAAKKLGVSTAIIIETMDPEPRYKDVGMRREELVRQPPKLGQTITARKITELYPWMTRPTVYRSLAKLVKDGYLAKASPKARMRWNDDDPFDQYLEPVRSNSLWTEADYEPDPATYTLIKSRWPDVNKLMSQSGTSGTAQSQNAHSALRAAHQSLNTPT